MDWYNKAYVLSICDSDPADCQAKMNQVPFYYLMKSGHGIGLKNVNDFAHAYTIYTKANTRPDIESYSDHFVFNLDIKIVYPPLDKSLDCFDFTKLSLAFPVFAPPTAPQNHQVQFQQQQQQQQQQGLAPSDASLITQSITDLYTKSSQLKYAKLVPYNMSTGIGCPAEVIDRYLNSRSEQLYNYKRFPVI